MCYNCIQIGVVVKRLLLLLLLPVVIWLTPGKQESTCGSFQMGSHPTFVGYPCTNVTIADDDGDIKDRMQVWVPTAILDDLDLVKCPDV
jgi:hypothetical protein